ncbi:MAG: serine acetyltransferase [Deltaproteobacteria bacterium]|jgi:serine O-acetyltransferase|nr:serine acetyltransferase [Deltaproteobacteria bacterium]
MSHPHKHIPEDCEYNISFQDYLANDAPVIAEVTKQLLDLRPELCDFEYLTSAPRPSFGAVKEIVQLSRQLLFPGFFESQTLHRETNPEYSIGQTVGTLFSALSREICASIRHDHIRYGRRCTNCRQQSRQLARDFISQLPRLRKVMASDVLATKEGDPAAGDHLDQIILCYPGLLATMVYRLAHELLIRDVPFMPRIMTEYAHSITGIDIHPGARIGESFFIDHGTGVVVGETTVIGQRVRIYQGVTLGALSLPKNAGLSLKDQKRHPTLENDVIIYSGATILGGETVIGARSVVGGNVWLTESIPPDTKVFIKKPELIIVNNKPAHS